MHLDEGQITPLHQACDGIPQIPVLHALVWAATAHHKQQFNSRCMGLDWMTFKVSFLPFLFLASDSINHQEQMQV